MKFFFLSLGLPLLLIATFYSYKKSVIVSEIQKIDEKAYVSFLNSTNAEPCTYLRYRSTEWLIVGDSHNYAGWDFPSLAEGLGTNKLGSCIFGGFYVETLEILLDYWEKYKIHPKNIILGTSPRIFSETTSKTQSFKEHEKALNRDVDFISHKDFLKNLIRGKGFFEPVSKPNENHYNLITEMDDSKVDKYFETFKNKSYENWLKYIQAWQSSQNVTHVSGKICGWIKKYNINLYLVHIPESPFLTGMYTPEILKSYRENVAQFSRCSNQIFGPEQTQLMARNKFFINRWLDDSFPYASIYNANPVFDFQVYDLDHMNPVGAKVFTNDFLKKIKLETNIMGSN
ncbi:MAG: hypothetical protein AB7I27_06130 [Bacteriovoracaceae bacterium]